MHLDISSLFLFSFVHVCLFSVVGALHSLWLLDVSRWSYCECKMRHEPYTASAWKTDGLTQAQESPSSTVSRNK